MNETINKRSMRVANASAGQVRQQAVWMTNVEGETFVAYNKQENKQPVKALGRLRGRRHFSSEKQAGLVREWYAALGADLVQVTPGTEVPLVEINDLDLIALSKIGLASREMMVLANRLDVSGKEMARLLTLSQRTFHRRQPDELLDQVASERLFMLTKLADHGFEVFDDQGKFNRWLRRPLRILGDQAPLDILDTSQGISMIETLLGRMEYGVYS